MRKLEILKIGIEIAVGKIPNQTLVKPITSSNRILIFMNKLVNKSIIPNFSAFTTTSIRPPERRSKTRKPIVKHLR
jgi:hypothetical protein